MLQPWFAKFMGWPSHPRERRDSGTKQEESTAAFHELDSYAVAIDQNLELNHTASKRIAIIIEPTPFSHTSGYSTRFKNLLNELKKRGDHVRIIVPNNDPDAPVDYNGYEIVNIPGFRFPLYKMVTLTFGSRGLYKALKDFNPEVIHLTTPGLCTFATILCARILKKPLLLSYHTHVRKTL